MACRTLQWLVASVLLVAASLTSGVACAEKRVALVIGNSAYEHVPRLQNPVNDASDMRTKLAALGFQIFGGADLDRTKMISALTGFGRAAENADVALVFYAGHGLQVNGQNYLVPVDANVEFEAELDIALVPFSIVMQQLSRGSRINIALLDACRDNPFSQGLSRSMGTRAVGALGRGLSRVNSAAGTFIAYATAPDNVAQDGTGRNSPFTSAVLKFIDRPGLSLSDMMIDVRNEVIQSTNGKQVPWDTSSLTGRFSFKIEGTITITPEHGPSNSQPSAIPAPDRTNVEYAVWSAIQNSSDPAAFEKFLKDFPDGVFAAAARDKLVTLRSKVANLPKTAEVDPCDRYAGSPSDPERPHGVVGVELSEIDAPKAIAACRAAIASDPEAARFAFSLGRALFKSGNQVEAARMYRVAAEKNSAVAMNNLGVAYEFGYGVAVDDAQAAHWYQAAAAAGDPTGMFNLGLARLDGRGMPANTEEGKEWIRKAAEKGNISALMLSQPPDSRGVLRTIENGNIYAVINGPRLPAEFKLEDRWLIGSFYTYHWNNAKGRTPGKISFKHESGKVAGPWQAKGKPGQGGVPNAYWKVDTFGILPPGNYTVIDSDPSTWSTNAGNGFRGFYNIQGWQLKSLN